MAEAFLSEIRMFSFNFAPKGWATCDGQLLPIAQNQALFALLGTTYGGDGRTNFALPDLRGRVPIHNGPGYVIGQKAGEAAHTLTTAEIPAHTHTATGNSATATQAAPAGNLCASAGVNPYATAANRTMNPAALANAGGGAAHDNMPPYRAVNFCICLSGIFPSQN